MAKSGNDRRQRISPGLGLALAIGTLPSLALAQAGPLTMNGVPEQVIPRVFDVGLGSFTIVPGTGVPNTPTGGGAGGAGETGGATEAGASVALDTMTSRSWGTAASEAATSVGVNPSALAATCIVESGCQNVAARSGSQIRGAFQMLDATFESGMTQAVRYNPNLAGSIQRGVDGSMDPANQAIAAAATLRTDAARLQAAGISNPTVLDVRGGYNFGSGYTVKLAQAADGDLMSGVLSSYTPSQLTGNGITSTTTVGQWRATVAAKMGDAAYQPVLTGI
ncbi:putative cytosolic protein (plasmid) [Roseomonas mucosa]|nr:putative cytosolic protein [Roseomonas mucosa]